MDGGDEESMVDEQNVARKLEMLLDKEATYRRPAMEEISVDWLDTVGRQ